LRIFFKRERTHYIDTDLQGKVLNLAKKIERAKGGKQLAGISPGIGALGIHDQGSNAAKTRGVCFPALSVPVNTLGTFSFVASERLRDSGARGMRFVHLPGF
jgi:hypothetical protein